MKISNRYTTALRYIVFAACLFFTLPGANAQELPPWALGPFVRPAGVNPILTPSSSSTFYDPMSKSVVRWEASDVFNPAAAVYKNKIYVVYRAEDSSGMGIGMRTSRLGLAASTDGIHMSRRPTPVLYPANDNQKPNEWPGGCEDPRIAVSENGTYVMLYTQWNKKVPRLAVATSKDLVNWIKHGPAFAKAYNGKYKDLATKSGSVITGLKNDRQVITKINGKYWMYWGERFINPATSTDLVNWQPMQDNNGELLQIVQTRNGYFDSDLTECGPPAVITPNGILLIYNGKNKPGEGRDERYTANTYSAGQLLFDANDPTRVLQRLDQPFFVPTAPFEKSGQYPAGTVFMEGLVFYKGKWYLYYGCADSLVAVAVYDPGR